jgi:hypothetical protein
MIKIIILSIILFLGIYNFAMNALWILSGAVYDSWDRTMIYHAKELRDMPRKSNIRLRRVK